MQTPGVGVKKRGRPRKRRIEDVQIEGNCNGFEIGNNVSNCKRDDSSFNGNEEDARNTGSSRRRGRPPKRRAVDVKGEATVGRYVLKEFEGSGVFLGKIVSYDSRLYRVDYEDGDFEDLDSGELRDVLIADERQVFVGDLLERKKKLDESVANKSGVKSESDLGIADSGKVVDELQKGNVMELIGNVDNERDSGNFQDDAMKVEVPTSSENDEEEIGGSEVDDDVYDSSSDSCEYGQGWETRSEIEIPNVPSPELPPSSGTIGVPEEFVSHLLSVYGFLRSFSIRLFLSPFTLDDLVGCLNCNVPNTLLDAIHVALLRALRRHLESQASDGSELASKCLRCVDWAFLDTLTWPVYLVHYLMVMGHLNRKEWKGFYVDVMQKDYCALSIGMKLTVLQILCDGALDTAEIRAEIDNREGSEVGVESDTLNPLDNGSRKVLTRSSKASVCKDAKNVNSEAGNDLSVGFNTSTVKRINQDTKSDKLNEDENGDECRLCGMDGMLLCCDGCPSAYHSRCIGVNKLSIPEGKWFCQECKVSRIGPPITTETLLRGAELFGVDPYTQLFLGTCNHLLVLKVSVKASPFVRYYNRKDIPKVVTALCLSPHHAVYYSGICSAILKYWELPQDWLPILASSQIPMDVKTKDDGLVAPSADNESQVLHKAELEDYGSAIKGSVSNYVSGTGMGKFSFTPGSEDVFMGEQNQYDLSMPSINGTAMNEIPTNTSCENAEFSCFSRIGQGDGSNMTGISTCTSANKDSNAAQKSGFCLPGNLYMHRKEEKKACGRAVQHLTDLYMGSSFKPYAYINHYVHGEYAACAAANFAELSTDENRSFELHGSDLRKVMSANVMLQTKAFSSAAARFFWPSTEKKLVEIPRERCSWCLHCKAPVTSKKACLLNQAALNATRAQMRFCSGLRMVKNVEGGLYGIAAYTLYMEESLRGLIVGPFKCASYQKQWRMEVEQASTCSEMKSLLLELEKNLCTNALSSEWTKLVDKWMDESSVPQSACATGSFQKRGPGRRKKHISTSDIIGDETNDTLSDLSWRSGKLSKLVFQKGTLPCSALRKAARQGGARKISGIHYAEGYDIPKRSRQFIWRAAVEMCMNASGLALQVRYLDCHIKWSDLFRPEQSVLDGKGLESEAYAFRGAQICDKKAVDSKIMYGVVFGHQKHLSSRLMKSIIEKEETQDGKVKYWFLESRIPLYLIREYEEQIYLPSSKNPGQKPDSRLSKHQKKQLKTFRKRSIYLYLNCKRDGVEMCHCASCHGTVCTGVSARCSACEGYCHKACVINSTVMTNDDVAFATICKQCSGKTINQNGAVESPTSPLAVQGQDFQSTANVVEGAKLKATSQQYQNSLAIPKGSSAKSNGKTMTSAGASECYSAKKPAASCDSSLTKKKRPCHWGLIWKKKLNDSDDGSEFRSKNILYRGISQGVNSFTPECQLCQKPYSPHLMYVRCETCQNWHHADAVELDESKLPNLMGYKCCRCRRIKIPVCPYADKNTKKLEVKKVRIRGPKEDTMLATDSASEAAMSEQAESLPATPMSPMDDVYIQVDDPLLLSISQVEEIPEPSEVPSEWNTPFGAGPQKLPVRRHIKNERDDEGLFWSDDSAVQLPTSLDNKDIDSSHQEWDVSNGGFENGAPLEYEDFNYDNTDFEPQTYFSFTELLEADDGNNQFEGVDVCGDGWENLPCEYPQSGFPVQCDMETVDTYMPATSMDSTLDAACNICSQTTPVPDRSCHICGLKIHSQCCPGEEVSLGESWRCVNCREWP